MRRSLAPVESRDRLPELARRGEQGPRSVVGGGRRPARSLRPEGALRHPRPHFCDSTRLHSQGERLDLAGRLVQGLPGERRRPSRPMEPPRGPAGLPNPSHVIADKVPGQQLLGLLLRL